MDINKAHKIRVGTNILQRTILLFYYKKFVDVLQKEKGKKKSSIKSSNLDFLKNFKNEDSEKNDFFLNLRSNVTKKEEKKTNSKKEEKKKISNDPVCYGDIIYLYFDYFSSKSQKMKKAVLYSDVLPGNRITGRCTKGEYFDFSTSKSLFQILPKSRNINNKNLEKSDILDAISGDEKILISKDNEESNEMDTNNENYVLYGQTIILKHIYSGCYLSIDLNFLSTRHNSLRIILTEKETETSFLKIKPSTKINSLGGIVKFSDNFFLCRAKDESIYLTPVEEEHNHEEESPIEGLNRPFEWKVNLFSKKINFIEKSEFINIGDIVMIQHSEYDKCLSLSVDKNSKNDTVITFIFKNLQKGSGVKQNEVSIKKRDFYLNDNYELIFEDIKKNSIYSLWEVKGSDNFESDLLENENIVRFKNVATDQYISINTDDYKILMTDYFDLDKNSYFNIKQKTFKKQNSKLNYEDVYKIKNLTLNKNLLIKEEKCESTMNPKKWKLNNNIFEFEFSKNIKITKKNNFGISWGKSKTSQSLFKFVQKNEESILIYKITTIKNFLLQFYNLIFDWGIKKNNNFYYLEYDLLINQIKFIKENFQIFDKFMKHLTNLILHNSIVSKSSGKKMEDNIIENMEELEIMDILINIIELIDTRIYRSLIEIVDYSFKDQSDFGKYKKLKSCFVNNKLNNKQYSQIFGKNILDKVIITALNFLNICLKKKNTSIMAKINEKLEIFVNLSFFYTDQIITIFKALTKPSFNKIENYSKSRFIDIFLKNFLYREEDLLNVINNIVNYKEIFYSIIQTMIDIQDFETLKEYFNYLNENLKLKFCLNEAKKIVVQFFFTKEKFAVFENINNDKIDFEKKNQFFELNLESLTNSFNLINKFIAAYLEIISAFFEMRNHLKKTIDFEKTFINIETIFEVLKSNCNIHLKKVFYQIIRISLYDEKSLKKINDFVDTNNFLFYIDNQKNFLYKDILPINWINPESKNIKINKNILNNKKVIREIFNECIKNMREFAKDLRNKNIEDLKYLKEIIFFVQTSLLYGVFNFQEISILYKNLMKFLQKAESDFNFEKKKKNTNKQEVDIRNKKEYLWLNIYFKIQHYCYKIFDLINKTRLFYQLNFIAYLFVNRKEMNEGKDLNFFSEIKDTFRFFRFGPLKEKQKKQKRIKEKPNFKKNQIFNLKKESRTVSVFLDDEEDEEKMNHFEGKFLEYHKKYFNKLKSLQIYWESNFCFYSIKYFQNQIELIKKIQSLSFSIYSDYFGQREIIYKILQKTVLFEKKDSKIFLKINQKNIDDDLKKLNLIVKSQKSFLKKNYLENHRKEVSNIFEKLNKTFKEFFEEKIFFNKFQNYLLSKGFLHITVEILNNDFFKKIQKEDFLIKSIFKFIEYMLMKNTYNQVLFFPNFKNLYIFFKSNFNTSNIMISLLSYTKNTELLLKITDSFLEQYANCFWVFKKIFSFFVKKIENSKSDDLVLDENHLNYVINLNNLFLSLIITKKGEVNEKIKKNIFLFFFKEKIIDNIFNYIEMSIFKNKIKSFSKEISKLIIDLLSSIFDLIAELLNKHEFNINCFVKSVILEKFVFIILDKGSFFVFKGKILKIFSIVYLKNTKYLLQNDYVSDIFSNTILKDLKMFNFFLTNLCPFDENNTRKREIVVEEILKEIGYENNPDQNQNEEINSNILFIKEEYWAYLCKSSGYSNYGLLYFSYEFLLAIYQCVRFEKNSQDKCISEADNLKILEIFHEMKTLFTFFKKSLFKLTREYQNLNLGNLFFISSSILELIGKFDKVEMNLNEINEEIQLENKDEKKAFKSISKISLKEDFKSMIVKNVKKMIFKEKKDLYFILNQFLLDQNLSTTKKFAQFIDFIGLNEDKITFKIMKNKSEVSDEYFFLEFIGEIEKLIFKSESNFQIYNLKLTTSLLTLNKDKKEIDSYLKVNNFFEDFFNKDLKKKYLNLKNCEKEITFFKKKIKKIFLDKQKNKEGGESNPEMLINLHDMKNNKNSLYVILFCINSFFDKKIKKIDSESNQLNKEKKNFKLAEIQNRFKQKKLPDLLLKVFCGLEDFRIDMIIIKIFVSLLKYGNKNIQIEFFELLFHNKRYSNFFNKIKFYINFFKQAIFHDLDLSIKKSKKKEELFIEHFYKEFYCFEKCSSLLTIFMLLQNFCENCYTDFQLFLSKSKNSNLTINFLEKVSNFFVNFCNRIILENESYKKLKSAIQERVLGISFSQKGEKNNLYYTKLIDQTYLTLEDLILGPCEENVNYLYENEKIIKFFKYVIDLKMETIEESNLVRNIFTKVIKLLSLLINENTKNLIKFSERLINRGKLAEKMLILFQNFIRGNEENFKKEIFCEKYDKYGEEISVVKNCFACTLNKCFNKRITTIQQSVLNTCFDIFSILKTLDYFDNIKKKSVLEIKNSIHNFSQEMIICITFFTSLEDQVEIFYNNKIINFKFKIPFICFFKHKNIKDQIIRKTVRTSHHEKIENFIQKLPIHIEEMKLTQKISSFMILSKFLKYESKIYYFRFFLILVLNIFILITLEYDYDEEKNVTQISFEQNSLFNLINKTKWFIPFYYFLSVLIFLIILLEIGIYIIKKRPVKKGIEIAKLRQNISQKENGKKSLKRTKINNILKKIKTNLHIFSFMNIFLIFSSFLAFYYPFFWGVILLDVISKNKEMRDIVKSITLNSVQLLKTVALALIVMYIYSFLAFSYFPNDYTHDENQDFKNYCYSLTTCFISTVYNGIRAGGGIGDALGHITIDKKNYWFRLIFDLSFFIFVIICLLNIIFGIIIDTFADLRDKRNEFNDLITSKCFICEQKKFKIESIGEGWKIHNEKNHNILSYLHFFIFLENKSINDCSGVEKYVKDHISKKNYKFIPYLNSKRVENFIKEKNENNYDDEQ